MSENSECSSIISDANLVSFATELNKLEGLFTKLIIKSDISEQKKYLGQFTWFQKKAYELLKQANFSIVPQEKNIPFDTGMPVTALNITDFSPNEELVIDRYVEPTIMKNERVIKTGTVLLKRSNT